MFCEHLLRCAQGVNSYKQRLCAVSRAQRRRCVKGTARTVTANIRRNLCEMILPTNLTLGEGAGEGLRIGGRGGAPSGERHRQRRDRHGPSRPCLGTCKPLGPCRERGG